MTQDGKVNIFENVYLLKMFTIFENVTVILKITVQEEHLTQLGGEDLKRCLPSWGKCYLSRDLKTSTKYQVHQTGVRI